MDWFSVIGLFLSCLLTISVKIPYYGMYYLKPHPLIIHPKPGPLPLVLHPTNFIEPWGRTPKIQNFNYLNYFDKMNMHTTGFQKPLYITNELPKARATTRVSFRQAGQTIVTPKKFVVKPKEKDLFVDFETPFNDLFLTEPQIYGLKDRCTLNRTTYANIKDYRRFWSVVDTSCTKKRRYKRDGTCHACCQTVWSADSPYVLEYKGKDYKVITPSSGYQVVFQGKCKKDASCICGKCVEESSYFTWILVADPEAKYFPPVKFVPVKYSRMCHCVNKGI